MIMILLNNKEIKEISGGVVCTCAIRIYGGMILDGHREVNLIDVKTATHDCYHLCCDDQHGNTHMTWKITGRDWLWCWGPPRQYLPPIIGSLEVTAL